jgi:hypothetical protein
MAAFAKLQNRHIASTWSGAHRPSRVQVAEEQLLLQSMFNRYDDARDFASDEVSPCRQNTLFIARKYCCTTKAIVRLALKQPISLIISSFDDYKARQDTV